MMPKLQKLLEEFEAQLKGLLTAHKEIQEALKDAPGDKVELQITIGQDDLAKIVRASQRDPVGVARIRKDDLSGKSRGQRVTQTILDEKEPLEGVATDALRDILSTNVQGLSILPTPEDIARGVINEAKGRKVMTKLDRPFDPQGTPETKEPMSQTDQPAQSTEGQADSAPDGQNRPITPTRKEGEGPPEGTQPARFVDKPAPIEYSEPGQAIDEHGDGRMEGVARAKIRRGSNVAEEVYGKRETHSVAGKSGFGLAADDEEDKTDE